MTDTVPALFDRAAVTWPSSPTMGEATDTTPSVISSWENPVPDCPCARQSAGKLGGLGDGVTGVPVKHCLVLQVTGSYLSWRKPRKPQTTVKLQDREFVAAIREGREPNSSIADVLSCYRVLGDLERQLDSQQ